MKIDLSTANIGDEFETASGEVVRLTLRYHSGKHRVTCLDGDHYLVTNEGEAIHRRPHCNLVAPVRKSISLVHAKIGDKFKNSAGETVTLCCEIQDDRYRMSLPDGGSYVVNTVGKAVHSGPTYNLISPVVSIPTGRSRVRDAASRCTLQDRNAAYGSPEDNFAAIAALWSAYLPQAVSPQDVAILMILLKVARFKHKPSIDTVVDIAGYSFCLGDFFTPEEWNQYNP